MLMVTYSKPFPESYKPVSNSRPWITEMNKTLLRRSQAPDGMHKLRPHMGAKEPQACPHCLLVFMTSIDESLSHAFPSCVATEHEYSLELLPHM